MRLHFMLALALTPTMLIAQNAPTLASLKDRSRVLLVFAPNDQRPEYAEQMDVFAQHAADLRERDLVTIPVLVHAGASTGADTAKNSQPARASDAEQASLRHRFHVDPEDFAVILIGKDGGEKLRQRTTLSIEKLDRTIDSMPMRKDEMRQQKP